MPVSVRERANSVLTDYLVLSENICTVSNAYSNYPIAILWVAFAQRHHI